MATPEPRRISKSKGHFNPTEEDEESTRRKKVRNKDMKTQTQMGLWICKKFSEIGTENS